MHHSDPEPSLVSQHPLPADTTPDSRHAWCQRSALGDLVLLPVIAVASAVALYLLAQRSSYHALLNLDALTLSPDERWLLPLTVIGTTVVAAIPAMLLGIALRQLRVRACFSIFCLLLVISQSALLFDLALYKDVGRHLLEVVLFALLPQGHVAAGDIGPWLVNGLVWLAICGMMVCALALGARFVVQRALRHTTREFVKVIAAGCWLIVVLLAAGGPTLENGWKQRALCERLYGALPFDLRLGVSTAQALHSEPSLARLQASFTATYRALFSLLFAVKPNTKAQQTPGTANPLPNIVLIVVESFRHDVFTPELMPRLTRWSNSGLVLNNHYANSPYSETGLFALVYGRSPLAFHATLDARIPPDVCESLRSLGYECAFFTGHPKVWMRREEFMNEHTLDRYGHDDTGTWAEWDKKALDSALNIARSSSQKPVFAIVLLMSTHFEYRYPPEYERHKPVATSVWHTTRLGALGPEHRIPHWNRYRNSVAFIDDLVSDAIESLDPKQNIVIFTGDHGESIHDDGRYGHGYSFADVITRVPFAAVGGNIPSRRLTEMTAHVDLLPTLLHSLGAATSSATQGLNLLAPHQPRSALLLTHAGVNRHHADALLLADEHRLRLQFDLSSPRVTIKGLEDNLGRLLPTQALTPAAEERLLQAFGAELNRIRR